MARLRYNPLNLQLLAKNPLLFSGSPLEIDLNKSILELNPNTDRR